MPFFRTQNSSVLHVEMKLGVSSNGIAKVDLTIALNRILTHIRTPLRQWPNYFFAILMGTYGHGLKMTLKDF
jgi:hypothetical protein